MRRRLSWPFPFSVRCVWIVQAGRCCWVEGLEPASGEFTDDDFIEVMW